jgi:hypothetical protein
MAEVRGGPVLGDGEGPESESARRISALIWPELDAITCKNLPKNIMRRAHDAIYFHSTFSLSSLRLQSSAFWP